MCEGACGRDVCVCVFELGGCEHKANWVRWNLTPASYTMDSMGCTFIIMKDGVYLLPLCGCENACAWCVASS